MSGLHLSGSPWFLLLLAPGLLILWRQYRRGSPGGGRGVVLLLLQAAALLLLVVSLTGPEWVRRTAVFHNPSVAVLTDRSGSFRGGEYLGLGEAYAAAARAVADRYRPQRFDVLAADFHERAWPVTGFRGGKGPPAIPGDAGGTPLTSLAAVADFLDSAEARNLQAVFLLSDGRANLDSGLASRTWPVPVYPVVLPVRAVHEAQIERASWSEDGTGALEVEWRPVGPPAGNPAIRLLQGGKAVHAGELPAGDGDGPRRARIPWKPAPGQGMEGLRAVLEAGGTGANLDPWNDTVAATSGAGPRGGRRMVVVRPLRSLDEKGMADLLHGLDGWLVGMAAPEEIAARGLTGRDQVWIEAGALAGRPDLQRTLREIPARVVVYARPGALPAEVAGVKMRRNGFSPASEVRPARAAADAFPAGVVRLKSVSARGLEVPASEPPWREAAVLVEGGRRGLLMAWFPLAPGKEGLFLALPAMWSLLFDPQADFAVRENLEGLLAAAAALAERQEGAVKAVVPARVHAGLPFDLEYALPALREGDKGGPLEVRAVPLAATGSGSRGEAWPLAGPGPEIFRLEDRSLPAGSWALELARGGSVLRRDSVVSAPKAALELARIGFDRAALDELASQSGGRVLAADSASGVTSLLPDLPGAQVKAERTRSLRLHNTRWIFLLAVGLLATAWLLRKRWDLD